jgi:hypothetical protein
MMHWSAASEKLARLSATAETHNRSSRLYAAVATALSQWWRNASTILLIARRWRSRLHLCISPPNWRIPLCSRPKMTAPPIAGLEGERKQVTVLCCALANAAALAESPYSGSYANGMKLTQVATYKQ